MSKSHNSHRLSMPSSIGSSENRISTLSSSRTPDEDENNASFNYDAEFENSIEIPHVDQRKLKALVTTLLISKKIQVYLRRIPDKSRCESMYFGPFLFSYLNGHIFDVSNLKKSLWCESMFYVTETWAIFFLLT